MRYQIYCNGTLLEAVQKARLFADCKHFVDMPLKGDAEEVLSAWNTLLAAAVENNGQLDPQALAGFVSEHFEQPGGELEDYEPTDFNAEEEFTSITDPHYRSWAQELHRKWPTLCRRVADKVLTAPDRYSLIALPKPFVVPGGRFREMYYWDSFFTIKGLLASGMFGTVRGMIENMGHLIDQYGFVPNGNRIYYLNRSQPPLLTWCLHAYFEKTHDVDFLRAAMPWLEKEMEFFTQNKKYSRPDWESHLFRYHVKSEGPRPESYREDMESAEHIQDVLEKCRLWGDIAAAAESGRDFSSRWFQNDPAYGPIAGKMGSTRTSSIIPVDLNAIICGNLRIFAEFYHALGEEAASDRALEQYERMRETIHQVLWNEEDGVWFDYDITNDRHINVYHDTNFFPLFTGCTHHGFDGSRIVEYLTKMGVLGYPGGLPSSLISSGQQWDFPNAWAPTTWVIIQGLRACGQTELARIIAEKWIQKNYLMWKQTGGKMFEKYNVASGCFKTFGGGGEYEVQEGFGWTNGVVLDLLTTYQSELNWNAELANHGNGVSLTCECCQPAEVILRSRTASMSLNEAMARSRKCSMTMGQGVNEPAQVVDTLVSSDLHAIPEHGVLEQPALEEKLAALARDLNSMAEPADVVETLDSADLYYGAPIVSRRSTSRRVSFSAHPPQPPEIAELADMLSVPPVVAAASECIARDIAQSGIDGTPSPETLAAVAQMMAHAAAAASLNPNNILIQGGVGSQPVMEI